MDYGKTLHLPETEFPMRGNLPKREPEILKFWEDNKIYQKRLELRKDAKPFILHDGPPYANGKLHIGHALNKTLKDIIMKYKTMTGHYTRYIPGWDTHGLPIEHAVIKNTGLNRHEMAPLDLRHKCKEYALECVETQKQDFIRFGVLGEWERPYLTLRPEFEVKQLGIFGAVFAMVKCGLVPMPTEANWKHVYGTAIVCGIGFTMSIFVSILAFAPGHAQEMAKGGVILGSLISAVLGYVFLRIVGANRKECHIGVYHNC